MYILLLLFFNIQFFFNVDTQIDRMIYVGKAKNGFCLANQLFFIFLV